MIFLSKSKVARRIFSCFSLIFIVMCFLLWNTLTHYYDEVIKVGHGVFFGKFEYIWFCMYSEDEGYSNHFEGRPLKAIWDDNEMLLYAKVHEGRNQDINWYHINLESKKENKVIGSTAEILEKMNKTNLNVFYLTDIRLAKYIFHEKCDIETAYLLLNEGEIKNE